MAAFEGQLISAKEKDLGGFSVRRLIPHSKRRMIGPWIFFDHMGPATFPPGEGINVRPHPHINLATVTYLFEGEILHRDSLGSHQSILPGDINLMVAGSGIVHSEREREEVKTSSRDLHGLQLWHALPDEAEESDAAFHHYKATDIPGLSLPGCDIRVMMGKAFDHQSPVKTFCDTLYFEATMKQGAELVLPAKEELGVYIVSGQINVADQVVGEREMVVFDNPSDVTVMAKTDTRLAAIGGEAFPTRHIEWNFVSSRKERIEQAKEDWRHMRFPSVPGDEDEFIPLP